MRQAHSQYALAREPYKKILPRVSMHHMMPRDRGGPETEFNLFPWNARAHRAWHELFEVMTAREVWNDLDEIHARIIDASEDAIIREWCLSDYYHGKSSKKISISQPRKVAWLLECWMICFGDLSIESARRFLRYQMLFMIFGRYALPAYEFCGPAALGGLLEGVAQDEDRAWAFRTCFDIDHESGYHDVIEVTVHEVRGNVLFIPIH